MPEYVTKEQVIDWYRPYGQTDEPIPFETLVSDLRDMKTADVAPVRHGYWIERVHDDGYGEYVLFHCSECDTPNANKRNYCDNCGAKMDGGTQNEQS